MRNLLAVVVLMAAAPVLGQTCSLPADLYRQRVQLDRRYSKEVGNDYSKNQSTADGILREQRAIDGVYLSYITQVANGTLETIHGCCPSSLRDPVALKVCALSLYIKTGRKSAALFTASVPRDQASADSLWKLDEIVYSQRPELEKDKVPFHPLGPVSTYLDELDKLVVSGNDDAIRRYLGLFELAHGDAAEQMEDDAEKLFLRKPALIAEKWNIIRDHHKVLAILDQMMSEGDKHQAVSSILTECSARNLNCDGLSSSLK